MGITSTIAIALAVISTGVSILQHRSQQRKLKKQIEIANTLDVRPTNSGAAVIVPYGRTAINGTIVYKNTQVYAGSPTNIREGLADPDIVRGFFNGAEYGSYTDKKKEFLLHMIVIGPAGVNKVVDSVIQSESLYNVGSQYRGTTMVEYILDGNDWSRQAVHMFGENAHPDAPGPPYERFVATTRGVGLAYMSRVYIRNLENPIFSGEPENVTEIVEGMKTAPLGQNDNPATATKTFSVTMPRGLYHYCTQDEYGPGPEGVKLNLQSFKDSERISKVVVQGPDVDTPGTEGDPVEEARKAYNKEFNTNLTRQQFLNVVIGALGYNPFANSGYSGGIATGTDSEAANIQIHRYEYHGAPSTDEEFRHVIEGFLAAAPGAVFFRDELGERNLVVPDPSNITNRPTITVHERDFAENTTVRMEGPDPREYLNQITGRFANFNKNYAEDTLTFPAEGTVLHNSLLAEDNQVHYKKDVGLDGINSKYMAKATLANYLFQSRRNRYEFTTTAKYARTQPNDKIRLVVPSIGLDQQVIVKTKAYDVIRGTIRFTGIEYEEVDYAWGVTELESISTQEAIQYSLADPTNVTINRIGVVLSGSWEYDLGASTADVSAFDVEISRDGGTTWTSSRVVSGGARNFQTNMAFTPGSYRIRVAARGIYGNQSSFVESGDLTIPSITITNAGYLELRLWQLTPCTTTKPTITLPDQINVNMRTRTITTPTTAFAPWTVVEPIPDVTYDRYEYAKWEIRAHIVDVDVGVSGSSPSRIHTISRSNWLGWPNNAAEVVDTFDSSSLIYRRGLKPPQVPVRDGYRDVEWVPRS